MPEHLQVVVTGGIPQQPRPTRPTSATELRAQAVAEAAYLGAILERRDQQPSECPYCGPTGRQLYATHPEGPCPSCGAGGHNGYPVLSRRAAPIIETRGTRCGNCGDTFSTNPPCCMLSLDIANGHIR